MTKESSPDLNSNHDFDTIVTDYLDRLNRGEVLDPFQILAEHPELGQEILEELQAFISLDSTTESSPLGTLGDYTLRRQIGRGGMGVVYDAWENSMDRRVALKVLPAGVAADTRASARFLREAQAAGKLHHQNIVGVYSTGVREGTPWYSMEFVEGETLAQILAEVKDAEPAVETRFGKKEELAFYSNLAGAFAGVAEGLQHAHSTGIIHRDIKPSNLILDTEGRLRILDFGLARLEGQESLTVSGDFVGTPLYMSPEQARQRKIRIDHRTDVYSLGATMYEMLTWRPPFKGKDHQDTLSQIIERDPADPRTLNHRIPRDLETIVLKCLRKDAGDRYGTAEALVQDLRRFVRGDSIEARPESQLKRFRRNLWRRRRSIAVGVMVILLLVTVGLLSGERYRAHREEARRKKEQRYEKTVLSAASRLVLMSVVLQGHLYPLNTYGARRFVHLGLMELTKDRARADIEAAVAELKEACRLFPNRPEALYYRARGLHLLMRKPEALTLLREVCSEHPGFDRAVDLLKNLEGETVNPGDAEIARRSGNEEAVARSYEQIANRQHRSPEPYLGIAIEAFLEAGLARLRAGNKEGALLDFAEAKSNAPQGAIEPAILIARTLYLCGRGDLADAQLAELFKTAESPNEAAREIATLYATLGEADKALTWIDKAEWGGYLYHWMRTGAILLKEERKTAVEEARKLVGQAPGDYRAYFLLGVAYDLCSDWGNAKQSLEKALDINPQNQEVLLQLGGLLTKNQQIHIPRAMALLVKARELYPESPRVYEDLGKAHYRRLRRPEQALCFFQKACRLDPEYTWYYVYIAYCLADLEQWKEAHEYLDMALERSAGDQRFMVSIQRAWLLRNQKRYADALEVCNEALKWEGKGEAHRGRRFAHAERCRSLFNLGFDEEAEIEYEKALACFAESGRHLGQAYVHQVFALEHERRHERRGDRGDLERAAELYEEACRAGGKTWHLISAAECYEKLDRIDAAVEKLACAIEFDPGCDAAYRKIGGLLGRHPGRVSGAQLDRLSSTLLRALESPLFSTQIVEALRALTWHLREAPDPQRLEAAFEVVRHAVKRTGWRSPELLSLAAEHHVRRSENAEAVIALEAALDLPWLEDTVKEVETVAALQQMLEEQRHILGDNAVSYASIESLYLVGEPSAGNDVDSQRPMTESELERLRGAIRGDDAAPRLAYLEGRICQLVHEHEAAVGAFERVVREDPASPEPALRLAACFEASGRDQEATATLRRAIESVQPVRARDLWDAWLRLSFVPCGRSPGDLLTDLPTCRLEVEEAGAGLPAGSSHAHAVAWLLEKLQAGERIRINCGGREYRSPSGPVWARDCFYVGGRARQGVKEPFTDPFPDTIKHTEDDPIYETARTFFRREAGGTGYRIPLPQGDYVVTFHFAECETLQNERQFHIRQEGEQVPEDFDSRKIGFETAFFKSFPVSVHDGFLDIEFVHVTGDPVISALEIERCP